MPKNMPKAIPDTNVLVRAFLKSNGSDGLIFKDFLKGKFELLYSDVLLKELVAVLNYPRILKRYHNERFKVDILVNNIITTGKFIYRPKKIKICRDPDDDEILSIALAVYAGSPVYVVSGDKDLLELKGKVEGVKILTASEFLKIL